MSKLKKIATNVGLVALLGIIPISASAHPEFEYNRKEFTLRNPTDGKKFTCDLYDCTLTYSKKIEFKNRNHYAEKANVVDIIEIDGKQLGSRPILRDHEKRTPPQEYLESEYKNADQIYQILEKEMQVQEYYKKWVDELKIMDKELKKVKKINQKNSS